MYIKLIGGILLTVSSAVIGFLKAEELTTRVKMLTEWKRLLLLLQGELRFHHATLSESFENVAKRVKEPFREFLERTAEKMNAEQGGFEKAWSETGKELLTKEGFIREDGQLLEMLKSSLGYLDLTMQTETLNLAILQTEDALQLAKEQQKKKERLYQTMGITVGAILTLLII